MTNKVAKIIGRNRVEYIDEKLGAQLEKEKHDIMKRYASKEKYTLEESSKLTVEALTKLFNEKIEGFEDYEVVAVPVEFFNERGTRFNLERKNVVRTEEDFETPYLITEEGASKPSTVYLDFIEDMIFNNKVDRIMRKSIKFAEEHNKDVLDVMQKAITRFFIDVVDNFEPYKIDVFVDETDGKYCIDIINKDTPFHFQSKPENGAGEKVVNEDK